MQVLVLQIAALGWLRLDMWGFLMTYSLSGEQRGLLCAVLRTGCSPGKNCSGICVCPSAERGGTTFCMTFPRSGKGHRQFSAWNALGTPEPAGISCCSLGPWRWGSRWLWLWVELDTGKTLACFWWFSFPLNCHTSSAWAVTADQCSLLCLCYQECKYYWPNSCPLTAVQPCHLPIKLVTPGLNWKAGGVPAVTGDRAGWVPPPLLWAMGNSFPAEMLMESGG